MMDGERDMAELCPDTHFIRILDELVYYAHQVEKLEKKVFNADTFKGKEHLWAEKLTDGYVLYGREGNTRWVATYYDLRGEYVGERVNTQPFDFRSR